MTSIWWVYFFDPTGVILWCMYNIWISQLCVFGLICNFGGIFGFLYMMISTFKWGGGI